MTGRIEAARQRAATVKRRSATSDPSTFDFGAADVAPSAGLAPQVQTS